MPLQSSAASEATACESSISEALAPENLNILTWRENEAREVLQTSTSLEAVEAVCSLHPFKDLDTRLELLSKRRPPFLDSLLGSLSSKSYDSEGDYNDDKAKEILRITGPHPLSFPVWDWEWSPPIELPAMNAIQIAKDINNQVTKAFSKVSFAALVRASCGYHDNAVAALIAGVLNTKRSLRRQFQKQPQLEDEYKAVEGELRSQSPLSHWVVSASIWNVDDSNVSDGLASIYAPIQDVIETRDLPLVQMHQRLKVLAVLHKEHILNGDDPRWQSLLSVDFYFLEIRDHREVAKLLTDRDLACFQKFCTEDVTDGESSRLREMNSRWSRLVITVKACLIAHRDLVKPISKAAKNLLDWKNYFSAMALLQGLRYAGHHPANLAEYWTLLSMDDMYATYRECWHNEVYGLPFLFPHVWLVRQQVGMLKEKHADEAEIATAKWQMASGLFRRLTSHPGSSALISSTRGSIGKAARAGQTERSCTPDRLRALSGIAFAILVTFLVRIRQYLISCIYSLHRNRDQDIETGIETLSRKQVSEGTEWGVREGINKNTRPR